MAEFRCPEPDCGRTFPTAGRLAAHRRMAPDHARPVKDAAKPTKPELIPDQVVDLAVSNLRDDGALLAAVAPHLGIAIAGVPDDSGGWLVRSRAEMAGNLLRERARKNPPTLRLLQAFNRLHEVPDGLILATSLPAALLLDTGRATPDTSMTLPLFGREVKIQPMRLVAGDVIDYVKAAMAEQQPGQNGSQRVSTAPSEIPGGVENT